MTRVLRAAGGLVTRRHAGRAAIGIAVLLTAILVPASPALATGTGTYNASGVRIRSCPTTSCTIRGLGYPGQSITITCYKTGTVVNGNPYWMYHRNNATGVVGYSSDVYLNWTGTVPHC